MKYLKTNSIFITQKIFKLRRISLLRLLSNQERDEHNIIFRQNIEGGLTYKHNITNEKE